MNAKRKTVLHIIDSLYRGGAQRVVVELVLSFPEFDHIVCYWQDDTDLASEIPQAKIVRIPFNGFRTFLKTLRFVRHLVRQDDVDIIHAHMFLPNLLARFARKKNTVVVSTYHGEMFPGTGWRNNMTIALERYTMSRSTVNVAVSKYLRKYLLDHINRKVDVEVIYNFPGNERTYELKEKSYNKPLRLIATSNNQTYKNYPLLINAVAKFSDRDLIVDIYGRGMDSLEEMANNLNVKNVFFKGSVTNLQDLLPEYDVYVATSDSGEGFSLSLLEAMRANLVILTSDIPQFTEATDGKGIHFKSRDVDDFVMKLQMILDNKYDLNKIAREMNLRGSEFHRERFKTEYACAYSGKPIKS